MQEGEEGEGERIAHLVLDATNEKLHLLRRVFMFAFSFSMEEGEFEIEFIRDGSDSEKIK